MTRQAFDVDGLRCAGCVNTVKEAIGALDGVRTVDVALQTTSPSRVTVDADDDVDLDDVQRSLDGLGDFRVRR